MSEARQGRARVDAPKAGTARVVAVCRSERKGTRKERIPEGRLLAGWGLDGDAHAGPWHRQVSLLADESYAAARERWGLDADPGDFAENLTTIGISLKALPIGTHLRIGSEALLEITQIGKKCHAGCEIRRVTGQCIFPDEGVFGIVLRAGVVRAGDEIEVIGAVPPRMGRDRANAKPGSLGTGSRGKKNGGGTGT